MNEICSDFKEYKPTSRNKRANFLLFGGVWSGKSSLINTLYSVGNDNYVEIAKIASNIGRCTRNYGKYVLRNDEYEVNFFDSWGFVFRKNRFQSNYFNTDGNYNLRSFELILDGFVEDKHDMKRKIFRSEHVWGGGERVIDAVIFLFDLHFSNYQIDCFKMFVELAKSKGIPVFFVCCRFDLILESIVLESKDLDGVFSSIETIPIWKNVKEKLCKGIGDEEAIVLPFINYSESYNITNPVINMFTMNFARRVTQHLESLEDKVERKIDFERSELENLLHNCRCDEEVEGEGEIYNEEIGFGSEIISEDCLLKECLTSNKKLNVLLWGFKGVGKTTLLRAFSSSSKNVKLISRKVDTYEKFMFDENVSVFVPWDYNPRLLDEDGNRLPTSRKERLEAGKIEYRAFKDMVFGRVPVGVKKKEYLKHLRNSGNVVFTLGDQEKRIDCVLFLCDINNSDIKDDFDLMRPFAKFIEQEKDVFSIAIFTKVDKLLSNLVMDCTRDINEEKISNKVLEIVLGIFEPNSVDYDYFSRRDSILEVLKHCETSFPMVGHFLKNFLANKLVMKLTKDLIVEGIQRSFTEMETKRSFETIKSDLFSGERCISIPYIKLNNEDEREIISAEEVERNIFDQDIGELPPVQQSIYVYPNSFEGIVFGNKNQEERKTASLQIWNIIKKVLLFERLSLENENSKKKKIEARLYIFSMTALPKALVMGCYIPEYCEEEEDGESYKEEKMVNTKHLYFERLVRDMFVIKNIEKVCNIGKLENRKITASCSCELINERKSGNFDAEYLRLSFGLQNYYLKKAEYLDIHKRVEEKIQNEKIQNKLEDRVSDLETILHDFGKTMKERQRQTFEEFRRIQEMEDNL